MGAGADVFKRIAVGPGADRNHVKVAAMRKPTMIRSLARSGRPPRELAGEVDERILEAARKVFLERGFEGAAVDEIADVARAGKPTIYARYPGKEALFAAVIAREVASKMQAGAKTLTGIGIQERMVSFGVMVLQSVLQADTVGLIRLAIAEARRFPDLATTVSRMARERRIEDVTRLLGDAAENGDLHGLPAFAPDHIASTAKHFLDLVVLPLLVRALFGENLKSLRAEVGPHVARSVAFFFAACRHVRSGIA
jgi:AcrR family transcriptional regulator